MEPYAALENRIVRQTHEIFDCLPHKFKPREVEWVPLSAIAVVHSSGSVDIVSLATGMKCLPMRAIRNADGVILHDWHAETVAIRAFNRFLTEECLKLATTRDCSSSVIEWQTPLLSRRKPFAIRNDIKIIMYCSEAPCGDASMELVMEAQEDRTPWLSSPNLEKEPCVLLGRGSFNKLGRVRRKPARADSPLTLSKSCSDKVALKQCTSVLAGVTSLLMSPSNAYIDTLIIPESQYRNEACQRAFSGSGRMQPLNGREWPGGYSFRPFDVHTTNIEFAYSRRARDELCPRGADVGHETIPKGSNVTAVWIAQSHIGLPAGLNESTQVKGPSLRNLSEVLINGRLQGCKEGDPRGASKLSRRKIWEVVAEVLGILSIPAAVSSYEELKSSHAFAERRRVKAEVTAEALKGWMLNERDNFAL